MNKKFNCDKITLAHALTGLSAITLIVSKKAESAVGAYVGGCLASVALGIIVSDIIDYYNEDES